MTRHFNPPDDPRLDELLDALLDLTAAQRATRLQALAATDAELAHAATEVLAAADSDRLERSLGELADDLLEDHIGLAPGARLGAWQIDTLLGSGGMGRVYLGHRADGAFDMRAAIKVLRPELALPAEVLQHERNLLARLRHPALTRLLDGGISVDGHVYLVMELAEGQPLAAWLAAAARPLAARLALFADLAAAVTQAHRQRVVHGDIKPDNVLVDGAGRARLLDFGVAQIADANPIAQRLLARALTPGYAPPERLAGAAATLSTDVFALGKLLALLLAPWAPAPPSALPRQRDLAAIVAKATASHVAERYATVSELTDDLARWHAGRTVSARPTGAIGHALRFIARHKVGTGLAALALGLLLAGSAALWQQKRVIRGERDQARVAEARADTVLSYLIGAIGRAGLAGSDLHQPLGQTLKANLASIQRDFVGDDDARQRLLARLAELHVRMNDYTTASELLAQVGPMNAPEDALIKVRVLDNRAVIALHDNDPDTAASAIDAASTLLAAQAGDHRGQRSQLLVTRALLEQQRGANAAAIATLREALALRLAVAPADAVQTVVVRNSLALALMRNGEYQAALHEFHTLDAALASSQREHSMDAANIYNNHAATAFVAGRYAEAARQFDRARKLQERLFGPSAAMAALLSNYGKLRLARGELAAGSALITRAEQMMAKFAGADSIDRQLIRLASAAAAADHGDTAQALAIYANVEHTVQAKLGASHPLLTRIRAQALQTRAAADWVAPDDAAFATLIAALQSPAAARQRANLLCARSELALRHDHAALAATAAARCLEAWLPSQDPTSPRLAQARYLLAEATWRNAPSPAARAHRDAALQAVLAALPKAAPAAQRLAALASAPPEASSPET